MSDEIKALREELAVLRERVAVLESRPLNVVPQTQWVPQQYSDQLAPTWVNPAPNAAPGAPTTPTITCRIGIAGVSGSLISLENLE